MATTRLRKAFHYPSADDSPTSSPDELDEEHQDLLISRLQTEDAEKNDLYRKLFLSIPLTAAFFFLYTLLFHTRSPQQALIAILALSSLGCTAWILHFMPLQAPERKGKMAVYRVDAAKGPVEKYLVYLNAALAGLMLLAAGVSWGRSATEDAWREGLPMMIFGLTMFARQQLAPLDLEELQKAKYDYKGA